MKNSIFLFTLLIASVSYGQQIPKLLLCNISISELSFKGEATFSEGQWDTSNARITMTMSYNSCDQKGSLFATGINSTSHSDGCHTSRSSANINHDGLYVPVGILGDIEIDENIAFSVIYPNPSNDLFILTGVKELSVSDVTIYNRNGEKISANLNLVKDGISIDLSKHKAGIFIVKYTFDGTSFTQSIVKK